ncbi:tRNA (adenosine(37)-N6)-threonylcarbamoyltransferase complex ATPase subunit type 1 TsaE [Halocynthiibacter namhaensis]|uniref:tRNA (adenosine(37)-N6)-threonylcarbamoyltransferase complex ATPase subunit type 1 TsaE n=1 Tax=Halocynthiibacter namhaensis TaxID=1290553 RepID=UPI0005795E61
MLQMHDHTFHFPDENQTAAFAVAMAEHLRPGDCILLEGPVGAGKSHFARAIIRELLIVAEDIPSPTFTLVQTYDGQHGEIWHSDLYRLSHTDEVAELGLEDAFSDAICFVEWPDRLGSYRPKTALTLTFSVGEHPNTRNLLVHAPTERWQTIIQDIHAE